MKKGSGSKARTLFVILYLHANFIIGRKLAMKPLKPIPLKDLIDLIWVGLLIILSFLLIANNPNAFLLGFASVIRYANRLITFESRS